MSGRSRSARRPRPGLRLLPRPVARLPALRGDDLPRLVRPAPDRAHLRRRPESAWTPALMEMLERNDAQGDVLLDRQMGRARAGAAARAARRRACDRQPHLYPPDDAAPDARRGRRGDAPAAGPRSRRPAIEFSEVDGRDADAAALRPPPSGDAEDGARRRLQSGHLVDHLLGLARPGDQGLDLTHAKKAGHGDVILMHDGGSSSPPPTANARYGRPRTRSRGSVPRATVRDDPRSGRRERSDDPAAGSFFSDFWNDQLVETAGSGCSWSCSASSSRSPSSA